MCRYKGTPFAPAPARHTLRDTPRMALAPSFDLFGVPSISNIIPSTSA
uniref:Enolase 1ic n=1 Tax=Rhizophora mucronata TaxID=61149 RepID=A0A2P2K7V5_RHIMU